MAQTWSASHATAHHEHRGHGNPRVHTARKEALHDTLRYRAGGVTGKQRLEYRSAGCRRKLHHKVEAAVIEARTDKYTARAAKHQTHLHDSVTLRHILDTGSLYVI